jgi:hypothetical protein
MELTRHYSDTKRRVTHRQAFEKIKAALGLSDEDMTRVLSIWKNLRQTEDWSAASSEPGVEGISLTDRGLVINVDKVDIVNYITLRRGAGVRPTPHDLGTLALSGSDPPFSEIWRSPEITHSILTSRE